jgi:non-specific serine/threonine protein kinase/serine/threonine-protein kinase
MAVEKQYFSAELPAGARLGAWQVQRLIGRGGAGEVYLAARADGGFQQRAALKLLRAGAGAESGRFHSEREILARLEHPCIARLLDGGVYTDGRPYMVMEYVEGLSLTEFCDQAHLDLRARLALFAKVCDVVAYAHRSLVVHRDLKPRNILVTAEGNVKLLDFGVAKLLDAVANPMASELTCAPLTPDYAAPEQLTGQAITTATDVYALGVVLFEVLTARKPFQHTDVPVAQAVSAVLHDQPPVPSRASRANGGASVPAKLLEGDLDAIVAKCLRKEAEHRYESVEALQLDLQRYLSSEPVLAREGARLYVLGRFVRRHRWIVAAGTTLVLALAAGLALVSWQAHRIALERDIARRSATREEAVRYYLTRMFRPSAGEHNGQAPTARAMLDQSAQRVLKEYRDDPYLAGKVVVTLADLYGALEDFEGQAPLLEGFLKQVGPDADPESVALVRQKLANVEIQRGNTGRAATLLVPALAFWQTDPRRYAEQRLEALAMRGRVQRMQGDLAGSIATYEAALRERTALSGRNHSETASLYNSLAIAYMNANRFNDALIAYQQALEIHSVLERSDDLDALITRGNIGMLTYRYGRIDEAEGLLLMAYTQQQERSGDSAAVSAAMGYYGSILTLRGHDKDAVETLLTAVRMSTQFAGPASPVAVQNRLFLARALASAGDQPEASRVLAENLELARKQLGEQNLFVLRTRLEQARLAVEHGDATQPERDLRALIPQLRKLGAAALPPLTQALVAQGDALLMQQRNAEAVPPLREAVQLREGFLWDQSWELAEARERLGEALGANTPAGRDLLTASLRVLVSQLGEQHPLTLRARHALN